MNLIIKANYDAICVDEFLNIWIGTYTKSADIIKIDTITRTTRHIAKGGKGYNYCNSLRYKNGLLYARFEHNKFLKVDVISDTVFLIDEVEFYQNIQ